MEKLKDRSFVFTLLPGLLLAVGVIAVGLFHEWTSCAMSVLLIIWLFAKIIKEKDLSLKLNITLISVALIVFMYGISVFWAVDKGMAFVGFLKFLPVLLFCLSLFLQDGAEAFIKRYLPIFTAAVVIVCVVLMQIPSIKNYFSVVGRFAGTFQYPNAFALLVLVAELVTFCAPLNKYFKAVLIAILLFGIFYTGSRTVFVLAAVSNICMIFYRIKFSKKAAYILLAVFVAVLGISLALAFLNVSPFSRILKINFGASTFIGRFLYFKDAAPMILRHPFGIGYLGYFYTQTTFQTGVYSVKYIHNDILQFALDIGWIPAAVFAGAVLKSIFSKGVSFENRVILSVMFLHCLFDFDLQFIAVFMLMLVFMKRDSGKTVKIKKAAVLSCATVLAALSLYFSVALALFTFGKTEASNSMYPYNTDNLIKMLKVYGGTDEAQDIADSIIENNEYVYYAYAEKARAAYTEGDFEKLIKYKGLVFNYAPLVYNEYKEYCYMLINGITLYNNAGDTESAKICKRQLVLTKQRYEDSLEKVSSLGYKIDTKPRIHFPDDIEEYIKKLTKGE